MPLGNIPPPPHCDLEARPCVALPYSGSAIHSPSNTHKRHTHCLCDTHSVHIFTGLDTQTHTHNVGNTQGNSHWGLPPPPHALIPIAEGALCIHWLIGQQPRRGRERLVGGGRWRQQETEGLQRKGDRQIEEEEIRFAEGQRRHIQ